MVPAESSPQPGIGSEACIPSRTYNHDLLRDPTWQEQCRQEFPLLADVLIDPALLKVFGPFEDAARRFKRLVKWIGTLAIVMMVVAFLGAIVEVYGAARGTPVLPQWGVRVVEGSAIVGLMLACLVARWGPLRHRWMQNRFCAEVLRAWHFRRVLNGHFVDQVSAAQGASVNTSYRPTLANLLGAFQQAGPVSISQLIRLGNDPLAVPFVPTLPSEQATAEELLRAYDKLRVTHQDCFFYERANNLFVDFAGCTNATWVTVVGAVTGLSLGLGLVASFMTLFVHAAAGWAPLVVTTCTVAGIGIRSWGEGMRFEEEQDHYLRMHSHYRALKERWDHAPNAKAKLLVAKDLEQMAIAELRSFLRVHERAQFIV